jgi:predicted amidohydrolase/ribosomal protein S18 acetylase RimI-like enzyme
MDAIDLSEFERKIGLRQLRQDDYEQLVQLQVKCFPGMHPWGREQIESQLRIFPEGQLCIEYEGRVVASCSSLIIDSDMYEDMHSWRDVADGGFITNHNPRGDALYGIEIMVDPDYRGMKLARRLYEARKQLCREKNLERIIIGGRIPGYEAHKDSMSAREYVEKVIHKTLFDPVLTVQLANGFVLKRLIPSYMESDRQSAGWATLLEWANLDYEPEPRRRYVASRLARVCVVQYQMREIGSFDEFSRQCEYFVDVASGYKADFLLFPELITMQLLPCIRANRPDEAVRKLAEFTPQYLELFSGLAVRYNINIIGGSHFVLEEERLFNSAYLFKRNGEIARQRKLHINASERHWWGVAPGEAIDVFSTDRGKVAIQVGYDIEFPEVSRIAADQGAEIIFVPFSADERSEYLRVRYCAQARCIENQLYVAAAGLVGNLPFVRNMDIQYAQSGIYTPSDFAFPRDGIAAESMPNIETVIVHDVDLEMIRRHRRGGTAFNWADRRPDLYEVRLKR